MSETETKIAVLERDVDSLKDDVRGLSVAINGDGKEDGMKTSIANQKQSISVLCEKVDEIRRIGLWLAALMATGVLTMVWEAAKRAPR